MQVTGPWGMAHYQLEGMNTLKHRSPRELPRQALHFADKLGEGRFGTVSKSKSASDILEPLVHI